MSSVLKAIVKLPRYVKVLATNGKDETNAVVEDSERKERKRIIARNSYRRNKDRIRKRQNDFYIRHKEKIKEHFHKYYQNNRDLILAKKKIYNAKNKERIKEYHKRYYQQYKEQLNKKARQRYLERKNGTLP